MCYQTEVGVAFKLYPASMPSGQKTLQYNTDPQHSKSQTYLEYEHSAQVICILHARKATHDNWIWPGHCIIRMKSQFTKYGEFYSESLSVGGLASLRTNLCRSNNHSLSSEDRAHFSTHIHIISGKNWLTISIVPYSKRWDESCALPLANKHVS